MTRWFRMYSEVLDDPKVQRLTPESFKAWINLLCLAAKHDGQLAGVADIAFALRIDEQQTITIIKDLTDAGLIDKAKGCYTPHNWSGRQYKSDVSNERVKRHRNAKRNVTVTPPEQNRTDSDTETDTEAEKKEVKAIKIAPPDDTGLAVALWNDFAEQNGLSTVRNLTQPRKRKLQLRLKECGGVEFWLSGVLARIKASPFLLGENDRGWKANFDFLMQESSFTKLLEGSYDKSKSNGSGNPNSIFAAAELVKREMAERHDG